MKAVLDTNIVVDHIEDLDVARVKLGRYPSPLFSVASRVEVMVGAADDDQSASLRHFLKRLDTLDIDSAVADTAVHIRRERRLRLPDAIIWATTHAQGACR